MRELTKFHDKFQNIWDIKKEDKQIVMVKNGKRMVFFMNNEQGERLMKRKINKLRG